MECRAAMSMARFWRDQGKPQRDLLAPVYGWFTEGFDTLDLKEAKALLDKLALEALIAHTFGTPALRMPFPPVRSSAPAPKRSRSPAHVPRAAAVTTICRLGSFPRTQGREAWALPNIRTTMASGLPSL
jgi:hypothetical protein